MEDSDRHSTASDRLRGLSENKDAFLEGYSAVDDQSPELPFSEDGSIYLVHLGLDEGELDRVEELQGEDGMVRQGYVDHVNSRLNEVGLPSLDSDEWLGEPIHRPRRSLRRLGSALISFLGLH